MAMTAAQYAAQLQALLPPGAALDTMDGVLPQLLQALAQELARVDASSDQLGPNALPDTTTELIQDWENVCGLLAQSTDLVARRQAVLQLLTDLGGSSIAYFKLRAAALGIPVSIDEFLPARCSYSSCGASINGNDWPFAFRTNLLTNGTDSPPVRADIAARAPSHEVAVFGVGYEAVQADVDIADALFYYANYTLPEAVET